MSSGYAQLPAKETGLAYVLWFFLGGLGIHHFYLGKNKRALSYLLCTLFVIGTPYVAVMLIIDLFTLPKQVREVNSFRVRGIEWGDRFNVGYVAPVIYPVAVAAPIAAPIAAPVAVQETVAPIAAPEAV